MIWLSTGPIVCGLLDGKVRALQVKSNKSHSLYVSESLVVALAPNPRGTGFLSGHADGNIIRYNIQLCRLDSTSDCKYLLIGSMLLKKLVKTQNHKVVLLFILYHRMH